MNTIAKRTITELLIEFQEDEVEIAKEAGVEIIRAEGAGNRPRAWIHEDEVEAIRELLESED